MGDVFDLPLARVNNVPQAFDAEGRRVVDAWESAGKIEAENLRVDAIIRAVNLHDDLLQKLKDLAGLAAMRPGKLHEYKAAIDEANALITKAEGGA